MEFYIKQDNYFERIIGKIVALGWKLFIKNPHTTLELIVQKFYANVLDVVNNMAMVRGVQVLFGPLISILFYGLINIG